VAPRAPGERGDIGCAVDLLSCAHLRRCLGDMAGPRVYGMAEPVRGYLRARRKHRPIVPVRLPGKAARAFRGGANLAPNRAVGPGRSSWPNE
jgi:hypothetical protein